MSPYPAKETSDILADAFTYGRTDLDYDAIVSYLQSTFGCSRLDAMRTFHVSMETSDDRS